MPVKKQPTNYISYELQSLEQYIGQLKNFLDNNPPDMATDRLEIIETARGSIIKVIATKEAQVKAFTDILKMLPNLLFDLNRLRKEVDTNKKDVEIRGGQEMPGFMAEDDEEDEPVKPTKKSKSTPKREPTTFDDDTYYEEVPPETPKELPAPKAEDEDEDADWVEDD